MQDRISFWLIFVDYSLNFLRRLLVLNVVVFSRTISNEQKMTDALDGWIQQIGIDWVPVDADLKFSESNDGPPKFAKERELSLNFNLNSKW